jgi:hypothetical protein
MFKIMMLLRKKAGMTREEFIDYYDNRHVPFMHSILPQGAAIHRRNFIVPAPQAAQGEGMVGAAECDVIVELFYEDVETVQRAMHCLADPLIQQQMAEDESRFIMPGSIRRFIVEPHETVFRSLDGVAR